MRESLRMLREVLRRPEKAGDKDGPRFDRRRAGRAADLLRPHARPLALAVLLTIPSTLFLLPQPYLLRFVVDRVFLAQDWMALRWIAAVYLTLLLAGAAYSWFQGFFTYRVQQTVLTNLQAKLFSHVISLPKAYFDSQQTGHLLSRVAADTKEVQNSLSQFVLSVGPAVLRTLGSAALVVYLNPVMALVALVAVPLVALSGRLLVTRLRATARQTFEKQASVYEELQQSLAGVMLIKSFGAEKRSGSKIRGLLAESVDANVRHYLLQSFASSVMGLVLGLAVILVVGAGAYEIANDRLTVGEFTAFGGYLVMLFGSVHQLTYLAISLQTSVVALHRVSEILELVPEGHEEGRTHAPAQLQGGVQFEDVSFSYDGEKNALSDVSFACEAGQAVAIVGPSGAGKTTLVSLIIQLYQPTSGSVLVDGISALEWDLAALRERVGFVSQDVFLLDGTIADNIRFGEPDADQAAIERAAQLSGADQFVQRLADRYDAVIGERGVKLSAGERQRISLARTLLRDPELLILDEPTSSVDAVTEAEIREVLRNQFAGRTKFVIAHRLSTVAWMDKILVLDDGRIAATGSHDELLASNELYRSLWDKQR